jgi:ABC-type Zn uptake system ZnuABC Zn-binding protein ZnuA
MGEIVAGALCSIDTANCSFYLEGARSFGAAMDSLSISISTRLEASGFNDFVAFHPAWSYFAGRFGLREHGTLEISHDHEPSAKHIAEVVRHMRTSGVQFIVVEEFSNADLAEGVASQTGARIVYLDPLGGADLPGRVTYAEILNYNVSAMEKAVPQE